MGGRRKCTQELELFSYEHFYVIYISFWNLDRDHDLVISQSELATYDSNGLSKVYAHDPRVLR